MIDYFTYEVIAEPVNLSPPFEEPLELPIDVIFKAKAHEQADDDVLLSWMKFNFDGDENDEWEEELEVNDHIAEVEVPDPYWTITPDMLAGQHSGTIDSKLLVEDSLGQSTDTVLSEEEGVGAIPVVHAVPHAALTVEPASGCVFFNEDVTFDASGSYDKDGPNQKPTTYLFDYGDGDSDEFTQDTLPAEPFPHTYDLPGLYSAVPTVTDEQYDNESCDEWEKHMDQACVHIKVFGPLTKVGSEDDWLVDDASPHHSASWSGLGNPCIALAINPGTGLPAVVYSAVPSDAPEDWPEAMPLFCEKTMEG